MKTKCLLFIVGIILSTLVYSQNEVCPSNNINTNPGNALNANAPDPKFINEFNWFAQTVNELLDVSIHNLTDYYPISSMLTQWRGFATRAFTCLGFQPSFLFISSNTYLQ